MVCIIYVSNMAEKTTEEYKKIFQENQKATDIPQKRLLKALSTCEATDNAKEYFLVAKIVQDVIISNLQREGVKLCTKNNVISSIINFCNEFYQTELSLEYFAKHYYMNGDYLCRLFKKETGVTFTAYINNIRINEAKKLLGETDKKITEIAFETGYTNDTYFIKMFKKHCGITPKQYQLIMHQHI